MYLNRFGYFIFLCLNCHLIGITMLDHVRTQAVDSEGTTHLFLDLYFIIFIILLHFISNVFMFLYIFIQSVCGT